MAQSVGELLSVSKGFNRPAMNQDEARKAVTVPIQPNSAVLEGGTALALPRRRHAGSPPPPAHLVEGSPGRGDALTPGDLQVYLPVPNLSGPGLPKTGPGNCQRSIRPTPEAISIRGFAIAARSSQSRSNRDFGCQLYANYLFRPAYVRVSRSICLHLRISTASSKAVPVQWQLCFTLDTIFPGAS